MHGGDVYRNKIELDFSVNINPCGIPESVQVAMFKALSNMTKYPDIDCSELRTGLSEKHNILAEKILCGNGASELIMAICNALKPEKIMMMAPGFSGYEKAARAIDSKILHFYFYSNEEEDFCFNENKLIEAICSEKPEMVFITNPNNPNGLVFLKPQMKKIADACKKYNIVLIIDECFCELSTEEDISFINELHKYQNVIILRAFTKSFALPGVRLGYLLCENSDYIKKIKMQLPEWNVSVLAQEAGIAALKEKDYLKASRKVIEEEKDFLSNELKAFGFKVYESKANFILFECNNNNLKEELIKKGILIRDCSDYEGLGKGFYRIAVKTHEDNQKLIQAIKGEDIALKKEEIEYVLPGEIEKRSFDIIGDELKKRGIVIPEEEMDVTKRVIHTSADFEYALTMCYSKDAISIARELIRGGADIVTDTNMAKAGINKTTLAKFGGEVHCFMADEDVAREAKERSVTRATVSMERAAKINKPVIFAIGNAPTALISLKELIDKTGYKPAFIIGVPVGFVNVVAAKELIMETDIPYIINRGRKGGSNVAAAICNALMYGMVSR